LNITGGGWWDNDVNISISWWGANVYLKINPDHSITLEAEADSDSYRHIRCVKD